MDHWGYPYIYSLSNDKRTYLLRSVGPDGIPETTDDLTIHGPWAGPLAAAVSRRSVLDCAKEHLG